MTEETIKIKISLMQDELNEMTLKQNDLTSQKVVNLSKKLDELIVKYLHMVQGDKCRATKLTP